jgi:hypothetical protein
MYRGTWSINKEEREGKKKVLGIAEGGNTWRGAAVLLVLPSLSAVKGRTLPSGDRRRARCSRSFPRLPFVRHLRRSGHALREAQRSRVEAAPAAGGRGQEGSSVRHPLVL